ncbi:MAG: hypothetical protein RLZZ312_1881, partial [Bacteroidota bacterium]
MEELDLLKKNWKKNRTSEHEVSENQIYAILQKGSSSVVKWILIVGILEFLLWSIFSILTYDENQMTEMGLAKYETILEIINVLYYLVLAGFIALFYKNYRAVSVVTNTRNLMQSILKVRKTVNYYIGFNLVFIAIGTFVLFSLIIFSTPQFENLRNILFDGNHNFKIFLLLLLVLIFIS